MPLALLLSPHADLYPYGSVGAVGGSNNAKLIHFLKNAQYFCDFLQNITRLFHLRCGTRTQRSGGAESAGAIGILLRASALGAEDAEAASLRWPLNANPK